MKSASCLKSLILILVLILSPKAEALWNGKSAKSGQFPAAVFFSDCTGAKVAARFFITAAHCVYDGLNRSVEFGMETGNVDSRYKAGKKISIHFGLNRNFDRMTDFTSTEVTIKKIHIHKSYSHAPDEKELKNFATDVALIEVEEDNTSHIKIAKINFNPVRHGTNIVLAGYGLQAPSPLDRIMPDGSLITSGNSMLPLVFAQTDVNAIWEADFTVLGPAKSEPIPGDLPLLGKGDSGGAVYLASDKNNLTIVGINSEASNLGLKSVVARLDNETDNEVASWLKSIL